MTLTEARLTRLLLHHLHLALDGYSRMCVIQCRLNLSDRTIQTIVHPHRNAKDGGQSTCLRAVVDFVLSKRRYAARALSRKEEILEARSHDAPKVNFMSLRGRMWLLVRTRYQELREQWYDDDGGDLSRSL